MDAYDSVVFEPRNLYFVKFLGNFYDDKALEIHHKKPTVLSIWQFLFVTIRPKNVSKF